MSPRKFFARLVLRFLPVLLSVMAWSLPVSAAEITPAMLRGEDFRGLGLAKFATHDYELKPEMIYAINFGLTNLVYAHQQAFRQRIPNTFVIRYRVFGRFEDYEKYSEAKYNKKIDKRMLGYFSPRGKEIVTWRQEAPWRLLPTMQHEGCHAIMDAMFGQSLPFWMIEGSADWLGEAPAWLKQNNEGELLPVGKDQQMRWLRLDQLRLAGKLPAMDKYLLSDDYKVWEKMFGGDIGMGYDIGWSVFDFFIKSGERAGVNWPQQTMAKAVRLSQTSQEIPEVVFARALHQEWPSGIPMFEKGWHSWIKLNGEAERAKIKAQRAKQAPSPSSAFP
ncbi:MAG: hypothetical protein EXS28_02620 [Pedosphaera sp.]|nr:hypothetical protein [Pedosphaera sp.]